MKFKIAVVQFEIEWRSPEVNVEKAERFIKKAADQGAQMIVFPEDFISDPIKGRVLLSDPRNAHRKQFQRLAKKYAIDIVPGTIVESFKHGLHNTAYFINSAGGIRSRYRKIHLWDHEGDEITPGREISVFKTKFGKIGLIICWDLVFPDIFRKMAKQGVRIVICPSNWSYGDAGKIGKRYDKQSEIKLVDSLCVSRAFENEIALVYCNAAKKVRGDDVSIGHSQITVPFRGAINKLNHNKEAMFIQEVDTDILDAAEKVYRIRKELKKFLAK